MQGRGASSSRPWRRDHQYRQRAIGVFFFFSSRRRHTRYIGDWSSDVCSSDLTEKQGWPQGENNGLAVDFGLNVYALGGGRQGEVQPFSKDDGVRLVDDVTHHRVEYFRLQQKCCGIGPVAGRHTDQLLALREMIGLDFGERTRSGNARSSGIPQLIAGACVERGGS